MFLATFALAPFSFGQGTAPVIQQVDELELIDEVEQPTITIRKPDATREITERKENGVVTEIKVQTGWSTYYLFPNDPLGSSFKDTASTVVRPAMWRIHEFDITGQKPDEGRGENEDEFDYTSDAPAPPSAK